jgi:hypothetical protein
MNESPSTNAQSMRNSSTSWTAAVKNPSGFQIFATNSPVAGAAHLPLSPFSVRYRPAGARKETTSGQPFAAVARPLQGFMMHRSDGSI